MIVIIVMNMVVNIVMNMVVNMVVMMVGICLVGLEPTKLSPVTLEITEFPNFSTDTRDDRTRTYNNNFGDYYFTIKLHLLRMISEWQELNLQPLLPKSSALPIEPHSWRLWESNPYLATRQVDILPLN